MADLLFALRCTDLEVELVQQIFAARHAGSRQSASDYLGKTGQIRRDLVERLRPPGRDPEPGDDFVEDEDDAACLGDAPQLLQEIFWKRDGTKTAAGGF